MKTDTVIASVLIALVVSIAQAAPDSPTLLRPGLLHVTIYDLDNHDKNDNAYAGIYLGDVVFRR